MSGPAPSFNYDPPIPQEVLLAKDFRIPDMRGSRILELRQNTYGARTWLDSQCGYHDTQPQPAAIFGGMVTAVAPVPNDNKEQALSGEGSTEGAAPSAAAEAAQTQLFTESKIRLGDGIEEDRRDRIAVNVPFRPTKNMAFNDWMKKWEGPHQRFGFPHARDRVNVANNSTYGANQVTRSVSQPPQSFATHPPQSEGQQANPQEHVAGMLRSQGLPQEQKKLNFVNPDLVNIQNGLAQGDDKRLLPAPQYPAASTWKLNTYGYNSLPCRYKGGISNWLPSGTDTVLWSAHKMSGPVNHLKRSASVGRH